MAWTLLSYTISYFVKSGKTGDPSNSRLYGLRRHIVRGYTRKWAYYREGR